MILTISTGSHHYAEMAFNLAVSAKFLCPSVKVAVITDGNIKGRGEEIFDHIIPFSGNPFEAKTRLPELTPFEKTLYLDADTVCLPGRRPLCDFLSSLQEKKFSIHNYGWFDTAKGWRSPWASFEQIQAFTGYSGPIPAFQTSAIYFDNSQDNVDFFSLVHRFYTEIQANVKVKGHEPDELAFSCAGSIFGKERIGSAGMPVAFCDTPGTRVDILAKYQFLSLAGEVIPRQPLEMYTNITKTAATSMGKLAFPFNTRAKRMK